MNKVKQLDALLARAEKIDATKTTQDVPMGNTPTVTPVRNRVVSVDETQYNDWRKSVKQFLTENDLTGFISEDYIPIHGNYTEFEEQYKLLKDLKRLDVFLETKLTFKPEKMEFYILRTLSTNSKDDIGYLDILAKAVGNADVRETLVNLHRTRMLNLNFSYGSNGHISYSMPVDSDKFLSIQGRNKLAEMQKPKKEPVKINENHFVQTVVVPQSIPTKKHKKVWEWLVALIGLIAGGTAVYFIISIANNQQSNNALNNAIITNSTVNLYQSNDAQITPNIKVIK